MPINQLFIFMMEQTEYKTLPRRSQSSKNAFRKDQQTTFVTNFYEVRLGKKDAFLYQYSIETQPQIPQDSNYLLYKAIRSSINELKKQYGYVTSSGRMLWGFKEVTLMKVIPTEFKFQEESHKINLAIKFIKKLNMNEMLENKQTVHSALQIYNNKLKERLKEHQMTELGIGRYFANDQSCQNDFDKVGLMVLRGFKFTLTPLISGLTLQIDVCSRVLRKENFLQSIEDARRKNDLQSLIGVTVITRYGKRRTYKVLDIDYSLKPTSKFYSNKKEGQISFIQYYKESYGLTITHKNQPLIKVVIRTQKVFKKKIPGEKQVAEKNEIIGFLIPEFVSQTGMSDQQRSNHNTMREIAPATKLSPDQRMKETQNIIKILNGKGQGNDLMILDHKEIPGFLLDEPVARLHTQKFTTENGNLNFKEKIFKAVDFTDWLIVYSQGKYSKEDDAEAQALYSLLAKAGSTFGIKFKQPGWITVNFNAKEKKGASQWVNEIISDIEQNGKPQIVLCLFSRNQEKYYSALKRQLIRKEVCSQMVRKATVGGKKNPMSAASKIAIQMNQKIGGVAWKIQTEHEYFNKRNMMYGAFSISKGEKGTNTLAFVGTINNQFSEVYSCCKVGIPRKQDISELAFEQIFTEWAKSYFQKMKIVPKTILVYREGLSSKQIEIQLQSQINAVHKMASTIGTKTKTQNYRPEIIYTTVNKKINTRFFQRVKPGNSGKFLPKCANPQSGSILMEEISIENAYDFHLAAQRVTQGTCTPTHFTIVYKNENSKIPQQALAQFTYEQCFNYMNWQGAVKVPACLQYANKLSKLIGENVHENIMKGPLLKTFFYL